MNKASIRSTFVDVRSVVDAGGGDWNTRVLYLDIWNCRWRAQGNGILECPRRVGEVL